MSDLPSLSSAFSNAVAAVNVERQKLADARLLVEAHESNVQNLERDLSALGRFLVAEGDVTEASRVTSELERLGLS